MKNKLVLLLLPVILTAFCGCVSVKPAKLVLAVDSSACSCVKNRCVNMESEVKDFIAQNSLSDTAELKVYDNFKNTSTKAVMDKYQMGLYPYIVLVDKNDRVRYRASASDFNKEKMMEEIKLIAAEKAEVK
ncbi:MAG TPA: hypothetical protein PLB12_11470 [Candidatus Goldiibacteriota bacterium]|nr:hypothetical protein [Candidatus Goldiibacteriota bacterium]